jgi:signal transduction histidine kinase
MKKTRVDYSKEKQKKLHRLEQTFYQVSHELRTPLNAINGITHLLLEEKPKRSVHYLSSLKFSGNYLTTFINEILELIK